MNTPAAPDEGRPAKACRLLAFGKTSAQERKDLSLLNEIEEFVLYRAAMEARRLQADVAEDVAQKARIFAWKQIPKYRESLRKVPGRSFGAFICGILRKEMGEVADQLARTVYFPALRSEKGVKPPARSIGFLSLDMPLYGDDTAGSSTNYTSRVAMIEGEAFCPEDEDRNAIVGRELRALPERLRLVAKLKYFDGMNNVEVGEHLGISRERVRQLCLAMNDRLRESPALAELAI